jgi:dUTP pyrophosphatase
MALVSAVGFSFVEMAAGEDDRTTSRVWGAAEPTYASRGATAAELCACLKEPLLIEAGRRVQVPTGIAAAVQSGYELQIRSHPLLALEHGVVVLDSPAAVDRDFRGELQVLLVNHGDAAFTLEPGARMAQILVTPAHRALWLPIPPGELLET